MTFTIAEMRRRDWSQVRAIYGEGLATGLAAFMTAPPKMAGLGWPLSLSRADGGAGQRRPCPRLGCDSAGSRHVRRGRGSLRSASTSLLQAHGQGIGSALIARLIEASESAWILDPAGANPRCQHVKPGAASA